MTTQAETRVEDVVRRAGQEVRVHAEGGTGWYAVLARGGLVAKGVSYGLVGALAAKLALGDGGRATSREGALQSLAHHTFGEIVLALLALGLAGYATWRFVQAVVERDEEGGEKGTLKTWGKRAGYAGRGFIYAGLTISAVKILLGDGDGRESQDDKAQQTTATILDWPAGRFIVCAAGVVIIGVGLWNAYRGLARTFEDKWRSGLSHVARKWGGRAGVVGHLARAVVFGLIGIFLMHAAIDFDPNDAIGLDGALRKLAEAGYGSYLLGVTAAGLVCYGLYCLVDARYRDVSANAQ